MVKSFISPTGQSELPFERSSSFFLSNLGKGTILKHACMHGFYSSLVMRLLAGSFNAWRPLPYCPIVVVVLIFLSFAVS